MIPKYDEILVPALEHLSDGASTEWRRLERPLAKRFGLTEQETSHEYASGNGFVFRDRLSWALSSLFHAGLIERPQRGVCRITESGHRLLETPDQIEPLIKDNDRERDRKRRAQKALNDKSVSLTHASVESDLTPHEQLSESYDAIRRSIYDDLVETILSKSPRDFEKLVVELLEKMGYGGQVEDPGTVSQYTNDGGIDGVIREDVLGLGRIHIQAKRYGRANTVGRQEVQKFVGALAVAQSKKGVFITTSSYSSGAVEYAESLHGNTTLILIDGDQLARFLYDYGVGMQIEQTIEIKKMDADYWDAMSGV